MATLYDRYKNPGPWEENLPSDLIPPIKHLRKTYDHHHWEYGTVTEKLCYWQLHPGAPDEELAEYLKLLRQLKGIAGAPATQRFVEVVQERTASAIFKAFFDLYLECVSVPALAIFYELVDIGKAHEQRLGTPHLEWAKKPNQEHDQKQHTQSSPNCFHLDYWGRDGAIASIKMKHVDLVEE